MLKAALLSLALLAAMAVVSPAQTYAWPPDPSRPTITVWPSNPPDASSFTIPEADTSTTSSDNVAGRPVVRLGHVSLPTLTVYQPESNPSGAAVVVFPGGGYSILAIDLEGTEVCQWLNGLHITCLVLKYRVPNTGP